VKDENGEAVRIAPRRESELSLVRRVQRLERLAHGRSSIRQSINGEGTR
jgi:hypothetical protein